MTFKGHPVKVPICERPPRIRTEGSSGHCVSTLHAPPPRPLSSACVFLCPSLDKHQKLLILKFWFGRRCHERKARADPRANLPPRRRRPIPRRRPIRRWPARPSTLPLRPFRPTTWASTTGIADTIRTPTGSRPTDRRMRMNGPAIRARRIRRLNNRTAIHRLSRWITSSRSVLSIRTKDSSIRRPWPSPATTSTETEPTDSPGRVPVRSRCTEGSVLT